MICIDPDMVSAYANSAFQDKAQCSNKNGRKTGVWQNVKSNVWLEPENVLLEEKARKLEARKILKV